MKNNPFIYLIAIATFIISCTNAQTQNSKTNLPANEFAAKINELPMAPIVDVRTPEEFSKGHLQNALNFNWNGNDFDKQVATLNKSKPVFVYCLSGGRSSAAAAKMRSGGFSEVYELNGGIMKWRGANLPETTENKNLSPGMSRQQFDALVNSDKMVLVDFYADWCGPCKKMKPFLMEISKDMADKVVLVRINTDDNQAICKELKINALPFLHLYKNKQLAWSHAGFIEKEEIVKAIEAK